MNGFPFLRSYSKQELASLDNMCQASVLQTQNHRNRRRVFSLKKNLFDHPDRPKRKRFNCTYFRLGFNFSVCARVEQKDKNNKFLLTERNFPIEFVILISKLQYDQLAIEVSYQEVNQSIMREKPNWSASNCIKYKPIEACSSENN